MREHSPYTLYTIWAPITYNPYGARLLPHLVQFSHTNITVHSTRENLPANTVIATPQITYIVANV